MQKYAILDLETTGFLPEEEQVTEVGIIITDFKNGYKTVHSYVALEKGRVISDKIKELTGITEETLEGAPSWADVSSALKDYLKDCIVVAQFASFDFGFIKDVVAPEEFYCTRTLNRLRWPEHNPSLGPTCERLGIELEKAHSALHDARATADLFKLHLDELGEGILEFKNTMAEGSDRPLRYIPENARVIKYEAFKGEVQNG